MSDVTAYHPVTEAQVVVPEESMPHLRMSGWVLLDEHQENQAAAAQAAADSQTAPKEK